MRGFRKGASTHSCSLLLVAGRNSLLCIVDAFPALWSMSKSGHVEEAGYKCFTQTHNYLEHYVPLHSGVTLACFWWK